jgi:hypothetical protein
MLLISSGTAFDDGFFVGHLHWQIIGVAQAPVNQSKSQVVACQNRVHGAAHRLLRKGD